ncbi:MAG: potassium transporter TrkG [Oscillospiraceae bacterium]
MLRCTYKESIELLLQAKNKLKLLSSFLSNPARVIVSSFALLILVGALILMLPICSRAGLPTNFITALFTATSATCVTGLIVVDTFTYFSVVGQVVILFLIQLGGLGLVTFATFFNIAIRKKIGLKSLYIAQESVNSDSMSDMGRLIKLIFIVTVSFEFVGACILATVFIPQFGQAGIFIAIFTAISAYCNAGFDLFGFQGQYASVVNFQDNPVVLVTIMALIVCGGLGFIVWQDIFHIRKRKRIALHTKIVLSATAIFIFGGALFIAMFEWDNVNTLGNMTVGEKILNSFFHSVSSRTAGFNSFSMEGMFGITKLFTVILMFIGAAPGGTGGGIKVTTFFVLIMTVICVMKGKDETVIGKRKVDKSVIYKAMAVVSIGFLVVFISTATIFFTSHAGGVNFSEIDALFESVSAFGTVGLSSGVTALANTASRIVLILTMFIGRVGPVSLALSLAMKLQNKNTVLPEAKIMVG